MPCSARFVTRDLHSGLMASVTRSPQGRGANDGQEKVAVKDELATAMNATKRKKIAVVRPSICTGKNGFPSILITRKNLKK
jgi:hypothetical protein